MSDTKLSHYVDNVNLTAPVNPRFVAARVRKQCRTRALSGVASSGYAAIHDLVLNDLEVRLTGANVISDRHAHLTVPLPNEDVTFADYRQFRLESDHETYPMPSNDPNVVDDVFDRCYDHYEIARLVDKVVERFAARLGGVSRIQVTNIHNDDPVSVVMSSDRRDALCQCSVPRIDSYTTRTSDDYLRRNNRNIKNNDRHSFRAVANHWHVLSVFSIEYRYRLDDGNYQPGNMRFMVLRSVLRRVLRPDDGQPIPHRTDGLSHYTNGSKHGYVTTAADVFAFVRREPLDTTDPYELSLNIRPRGAHKWAWQHVCGLRLWPYSLEPTPTALADAPRIAWPFAFSHQPIAGFFKHNAARALVVPRGPKRKVFTVPKHRKDNTDPYTTGADVEDLVSTYLK